MAHYRPLLDSTCAASRKFVNTCLRAWDRTVVAGRILSTQPVLCDRDSAFELHTLTYDQDVLATVWSLKTWYLYSGTRPPLVIYAGGPLSAPSEAVLLAHFPDCRIMRRETFNARMSDCLGRYPASLKFSRMPAFYCSLKLFGPLCFTQADSVLYFDSDLLFFRKPVELLGHIERQSPCFSSDYQDSYAYSRSFIQGLLPVKLEPKINAGLFHVSKRDLEGSLDLVEAYFAGIPEVNPAIWTINRHEQTLNAILLSQAGAARLSDAYQLSRTPVTDTTVSHHFVNDGSRPAFFRSGVRRLVRAGFLNAASRSTGASHKPIAMHGKGV